MTLLAEKCRHHLTTAGWTPRDGHWHHPTTPQGRGHTFEAAITRQMGEELAALRREAMGAREANTRVRGRAQGGEDG